MLQKTIWSKKEEVRDTQRLKRNTHLSSLL